MKYILVLCLVILSYSTLIAQQKLGVKSVISTAASKKDRLGLTLTKPVNGVNKTFTIGSVSLQVGLPYMGLTKGSTVNDASTQNYSKDLGFPWGIRYRYNTFSEDAFTVSKGYYSDRIEINWDIKTNRDKIISISVYRTEDVSSLNPNWGTSLKTLAADAGTFTDTNVEGGKLYRYKIAAKGVEIDGLEILYTTYITGIGYRNPTGVITGNISYTGGNPVKDVSIVANPTGSTLRFGSSLKVPSNSYVTVAKLNKSLKDSISIQTWAKPESAFNNDELTLYSLASNRAETLNFKVKMALVNGKNVLTASLGPHIISLSDYIPSGETDNKGDDILVPITSINTSFTHFSAVLRDNKIPEIYINGRLISAAYAAKMNTIFAQRTLTGPPTSVTFTSTNTILKLNTTAGGDQQNWISFKMGGGKTALLDEFRVWETALNASQILRDYRRYLKGNESYLNTYLRANEKMGDYAYDLAQTGFVFHGNDAKLSNATIAPTWANSDTDSNNIPTNSQLGVLGVSDEFGNYVISAIPYAGNGDSFTIVPSLGKHEFNPKQEVAFLGSGSTVVNNVDFIDQSSFLFRGIVVYDSRGVFPPTSDAEITGDIKDNEIYNAYTKGTLKYQKGEYWAEKDNTGKIIRLRRYATIPVTGAYVNIDNAPAIDANNVPIQTDINGRFTIEVPIGQHAISITKSSHTFEFDGRFPAKTSSVINGETYYTNTYQDFFEDRDEPVTFIDNTKIIVVGRVVGGTTQSEKTIGFGANGKKTLSYKDASGIDRTTTYTSINNIGKARLTLGYLPAGATSVTPEYKTSFETNIETGEYSIKVLPLNYILSKYDLIFSSGKNPDNRLLLDTDQSINFTAIKALQYPTFVQGNTTITGEPFQEILKFTHIAKPIYTVLSQTSDTQIVANGVTYTIAANQVTPIYSQFGDYSIRIQGQERYSNYDSGATPVVNTVPVEGGSIIATNSLALENSEKTEVSATDSSILIYSFRGGIPNTDATSGYKRTIDLKYRSNGVDTPLENYKTEGIILGGVADGTQTFVTAGPEFPDFVLRDPPGSQSSATIEKGSSFSFTKENSSSVNNGSELNGTVSLGFKLSLGGGLAGPVMETEVTNDVSSGVTMAQSSTNGKSVTNTYTFNQTISTSDDPSWIGSDADLYIGTSANQFYGTYNDLIASTTQPTETTPQSPISVVKPSNSNITQVFPKINKALYFNEAPEKTLFVYSQHNILNEIIPKYLEFIRQIDAGTLTENTNGVLTKNAYQSSVNLWRKIILNNELAKYQALNDKDKLKSSLNAIIESLKDPGTNILSASAKQLKDLLNATFYENISLDAGVGGFTKGYQIERLTSSSLSYSLQIDASIALAFGAAFNETGFEMETKTNSGTGTENSSEDTSNESTNISYTLKDSDTGNLLSVDVINAFDGNGPIFITKGGETSCPYEGQELSHFYNPTHPNVTSTTASIVDLAEDQRKPLSVATIPLELPEITVVASNVSGIFEGRNAEFVLRLRNTSTINKVATFQLSIDQSTNPDNALINIEPNGTLINIPAGQTVLYTMTLKKIKQDQFNYNNIRVILESLCDGNATDEVLVSASFVPACSPVTIMSPPNNWLLNKNTAFNGALSKPLNIKLGDYNTSFASFQKINLEYRLKGTPNWIGLRTYYKNQSDYTTALTGGDTNVELIAGNQLNYAWDIAGLGLGNGSYEIRARTSCFNQTAYESEIITGNVDLTAPVLFGTPTPKNGILNLGDDITLRFNEPVKINGTVTKFEFLVQKNQLPVKHEVSLAFNGTTNTATIQKPHLTTGDFSIEFWLKNTSPTGTSTLLNQNGGIKVELTNDVLKYTIGGQSISATVTKDNTFNYYALSYDATASKLTIIENSREIISIPIANPINLTNENPIVIGGNTFKGNVHDLRFWKKYITRELAVINMNTVFNGNELGLLGYWPMDEGNGIVAKDLARFKHLVLSNTNWDIFPKGTAYSFDGTNYLTLDKIAKVNITKEMDATLSFWMKTNQASVATLLSNGKGDDTDLLESNGYRNKWAFNLTTSGGIELQAENKKFPFGTTKVNDDSWHHIALSLTRNGTVRMYVDGKELGSYTSADLGGFVASNLFVGARGTLNSVDNYYKGLIEELCIWNMSLTADQIKADQYYEVNPESTGLLLYSSFNKPETPNILGPKYFTPSESNYALLNGNLLAFTDTTPGIKPFRPTESIVLNAVINGDQIVLIPEITDWASMEGKVAKITVSNLNDLSDNSQVSAVTWNAYINKNPMKWFVEGHDGIVDLMKRSNENLTFDITLINQGGQSQPYVIDAPSWLTLSVQSGTIAPNNTVTLKATVDNNLAIGNYNTVLSLATNYGYNEKIQLDLRVLEKEPILLLDPTKFTESMNIIGKIKLNDVFSDDPYDKVVALVNGEVRGMTNVVFDSAFNEYFVYLTVYSNQLSGENVVFYIWDASDGKLKEASLNDAITKPFLADTLIGTYTSPTIFINTGVTGQQLLLNQGWTWTSFNVNDSRFNNLNLLTTGLNLSTSDLIQSNSPALFDSYQFYSLGSTNNGWSGGISSSGGVSSTKMYKIKLATAQKLNIKGTPVDLNTWSFDLAQNWNWLPFIVTKNVPIGDALANLNANDGDFIKSQSLFAIYSSSIGWKGSLTYLKAGEGYMIKVASAQKFMYPEYLNQASNKMSNPNTGRIKGTDNEVLSNQYAQFPNTMSAIVKVPEGFENLAFYNETGQLRGNTTTENVNGTNLAFVTIYGNQPEKLIAYIGSGKDIQATKKSVSFSSDAILGSISDPIVIDWLEERISVSPNPFQNELVIAIDAEESGDAKITINNMLNQVVYTGSFETQAGATVLKIHPNITSGIYILRVEIAGKIVLQKIIKN
ncbi:LamG-like jellyroll fold domain-containing protein [Flavobacterium lacustre]|uniref:LamG-like jellyroll fold domain-containing protein n=1 Tax=Flavobacterium lacustre TaxID=3016339 RepID=UPI0022B66C2B|nr:LamG-like jellyroll fold domain-containing protein [Flavobacterium lacustre]